MERRRGIGPNGCCRRKGTGEEPLLVSFVKRPWRHAVPLKVRAVSQGGGFGHCIRCVWQSAPHAALASPDRPGYLANPEPEQFINLRLIWQGVAADDVACTANDNDTEPAAGTLAKLQLHDVASDRNPLNLIERHLVVAWVVKLGGLSRGMGCHLLCFLERSTIGQVVRDAGSSEAVTSGGRL